MSITLCILQNPSKLSYPLDCVQEPLRILHSHQQVQSIPETSGREVVFIPKILANGVLTMRAWR